MSNSEYSAFEEYKNSVYNCVRMVEFTESERDEFEGIRKSGFFEYLMLKAASKMNQIGLRSVRDHNRKKKYLVNADIALSNETIKAAICSQLTGTERLPIDIANGVTQALYNLPKSVKENFNLSAMIVAYMCNKLSKTGVQNYCKTKD